MLLQSTQEIDVEAVRSVDHRAHSVYHRVHSDISRVHRKLT